MNQRDTFVRRETYFPLGFIVRISMFIIWLICLLFRTTRSVCVYLCMCRPLTNAILFLVNTLQKIMRRHNRVAPSKQHTVKDRYRGLRNEGNTCYLNSLLQMLYKSSDFRQAVIRYDTVDPKSISFNLKTVFQKLQMQDPGGDTVSTKQLTGSLKWEGFHVHQQQDAHELLRLLMESLSKESEDTLNIVKNTFYGQVKNSLRCTKCEHVSSTEEDFIDIQVPVMRPMSQDSYYSIEDSLRDSTRTENINNFFCHYCKKLCEVEKGMEYKSYPKVLIFHLQRFDVDYISNRKIKYANRLQFPFRITPSEIMSSSGNIQQNDYELFAVLVHSGSPEGGHYYTFARSDEKWFKFKDSCVTESSESEVEQTYGGGHSWRHTNNSSSAYMLMYQRQCSSIEDNNKREEHNCNMGENEKSITTSTGQCAANNGKLTGSSNSLNKMPNNYKINEKDQYVNNGDELYNKELTTEAERRDDTTNKHRTTTSMFHINDTRASDTGLLNETPKLQTPGANSSQQNNPTLKGAASNKDGLNGGKKLLPGRHILPPTRQEAKSQEKRNDSVTDMRGSQTKIQHRSKDKVQSRRRLQLTNRQQPVKPKNSDQPPTRRQKSGDGTKNKKKMKKSTR